MKEMEGKTCLITGATSGIGSSAALKLSDMGADICFIARSQEKAKNLGEKIFKISGKEPLAIIADLVINSGIKSEKTNTTITFSEVVVWINN